MIWIKWHLLSKQVENRVDLHNDSCRDGEGHFESKQISETIIARIQWHLQSKKVENSRFTSW